MVFFLRPMQVASTLFDNRGRPALPMRSLWNANNAAITEQNDLQAGFNADLTAQQQALDDTQDMLTDTVADLGVAQSDIAALVLDVADAADLALLTANNLAWYVSTYGSFFTKIGGKSNVTTGTPNGSGDLAIAHGFAFTPPLEGCQAFPTGTTFFHVQLISVDATNLTVRLFDDAGVAITAGSWPVAWHVGFWTMIYPPGP